MKSRQVKALYNKTIKKKQNESKCRNESGSRFEEKLRKNTKWLILNKC